MRRKLSVAKAMGLYL